MTLEAETRIIESLDTILEQERRALLAGEITALKSLMTEKERLMDALNALAHHPLSNLTAIQGKLTRNQALLDATLQGIRTVAARLAAHRRIRRSMDTYDQHGRKLSILGDIAPNVEKRA